jgi:hypothetical protein
MFSHQQSKKPGRKYFKSNHNVNQSEFLEQNMLGVFYLLLSLASI